MKVHLSLALAVACAGPVVAAEPRPLEHVLVTIPLHQSTMETAFPVDTLTGDDLAREASATLGETLEGLPGLHNASFGPGVGQPVIRGLGGPRVMTLQNGTRSADVSSLSGDHAVAVDPMLADSIEVLRGPATLLYGGGAIGGVVNVVDGRIPSTLVDDTEVGFAWRYTGANNGKSGVFRLDHAMGNLGIHADLVTRDADPLTVARGAGTEDTDTLENTGARTLSGTLGSSFHFDGGFIGVAVNRQDVNYGLPAGTHGHHDDHDEDHDDHDEDHGEEHHDEDGHDGEEVDIRLKMEQTRYDAVLHLHQPVAGIEVARAFVTATDYEHAELEGIDVGTVYASDSVEGRLELVHDPVADFHGVFGLQLSETDFSAVGAEAFVPETRIRRAGLFVLEDWHRGPWQWEAGLRWDTEELRPRAQGVPSQDFNALSASLGTIYELSEGWHMSASVSRAERAPAVEELYSNNGNSGPATWVTHAATNAIELGNSDLDTEVGVNVDIGLTMHRGANNASFSVYMNDFQRYINLANTGMEVGETPVRQYEQDGARFVGAEFEGDWLLTELAGGSLFLETNLDIVRGELDAGGDIPRLPPLTARVGLNWSDDSRYYFTRLTSASRQDNPGDNETPTDSWLRLDMGGEWRLMAGGHEVMLSASLRNVTNEEIRLSTSWLRAVAPEAGRSFDLGVRLEL